MFEELRQFFQVKSFLGQLWHPTIPEKISHMPISYLLFCIAYKYCVFVTNTVSIVGMAKCKKFAVSIKTHTEKLAVEYSKQH